MKTRDDEKFGIDNSERNIDIANWDDKLSEENFSAATLMLQKLLTCYQNISIESGRVSTGVDVTMNSSKAYSGYSSTAAWGRMLLNKSRIGSVISIIAQLDDLIQRELLSHNPQKLCCLSIY